MFKAEHTTGLDKMRVSELQCISTLGCRKAEMPALRTTFERRAGQNARSDVCKTLGDP